MTDPSADGRPAEQNGAVDEVEAFAVSPIREGRRAGGLAPRRALLTLASLAALAWLLAPLVDELRYHFSRQGQPLDLGDATGIVSLERLPTQTYVRVHGVLGNKAATLTGFRPGSLRYGPIQVRQVLGSPIFVEFDQDEHLDEYTRFSEHRFEGRLVPFEAGGEMQRVRTYLETRTGLRIPPGARLVVVGERPGAMWRYPIAFAVCGLIAALSIAFLLRSARPRVIEDSA